MKVVQVNNMFASGSTGKIVQDIHAYLQKNGHESYVLFGIGDNCGDSHAFLVAPEWVRKMQSLQSRITGYAYAGAPYGTWRTRRLLEALRPDVVHLHCINGYMVNIYRLLEALKRDKIPTVLTLHAEFPYTAGCGHAMKCEKWKKGCYRCDAIGKQRPKSWFFDRSAAEWEKMRRAYDGFERLTVCAVSEWLRARAIQSPFYQGKRVITVLNGLNTQTFSPKDTSWLRNKLALRDKKVVLHVTPDFDAPIKGGAHVIEMARRMVGEDVLFIVVGAKDTGKDVPENMRLISHTANQNELAAYYTLADVCLLTSEKETFSMVCAESLCCGTPVVGFEAGAPETISLQEYSRFVPQGDDDALETALRAALQDRFERHRIVQEASVRYYRDGMSAKYLQEYQRLLKSGETT